MRDDAGRWITYNGEIYNYLELRAELGGERFRTELRHRGHAARLRAWGADCARPPARHVRLRALGRGRAASCCCARDRFGIKPFYYAQVGDVLYFASEAKALLPFLPAIETDLEGLADYLAFQFCLGGKTLFKGVRELLPGHWLTRARRHRRAERYWDVYYEIDWSHTAKLFRGAHRELLRRSRAPAPALRRAGRAHT